MLIQFKHHCEGGESILRTQYLYKPRVSVFLFYFILLNYMLYLCCFNLILLLLQNCDKCLRGLLISSSALKWLSEIIVTLQFFLET